MNAFNPKIGTQLSLGFGVILALILALGAMAWFQSNEMAKRTTDLYEHPLTVRSAIGELKADILTMRVHMIDLVLVSDSGQIDAILQSIVVSRYDALKQFTVLYDRYLGDPVDVDLASEDFGRWESVREETIRLLRAGRTEAAVARTRSEGAGGALVTVLMDHIQKIDDFASDKAKALYRDSLQLKADLDRRLAFLVAGMFSLAFLIVFLLYRSIRRPLSELASATLRFRQGQREARCGWSSSDEFGLLSSSFNELADVIEAELSLGSRSTAISAIMLAEDESGPFCRKVLGSLMEHTSAQLGAVYLLNEEKTCFEHFESIGMDASRARSFSATSLEGEFGPAVASGRIQRMPEIPEDSRFSLGTASGSFIPRDIVTIPLVVGSETMAVISLASLGNFDAMGLRLLESIHVALCARMDGVLAYRRLRSFSRRLEDQNRELEAQKNELAAQARELTQQNAELEMQKKQLDEANRLKTSFLSTMSHELRTPLNSVIALSGVLGRRLLGKLPEEEYSYLDVIERNGKQLLSLINDILDLSRIEAGRDELDLGEFDPATLLREVVDLIAPQATQKGIALGYRSQAALPPVSSDYEKCRHVLQNIVANAVKFTQTGSVEIMAEASDKAIVIKVRDTGIGIEAKDLGLIFDEFRQVDASASRRHGGTGLGLTIAKKYARLLGGDIAVESVMGVGSTFSFSLPLGAVAPMAGSARQRSLGAPRQRLGGPARAGGSILLVEDSEGVIIQMKDMLASQGYRISVARDGAEALAQIAREVPDAMILDLMMPAVDGFEVLRRIRENEETDELPVIILTAKYVTKEELAFLKHNHVHQLIRKGDINREQLLEAVAGMLDSAEDEAERREGPRVESGEPLPLVLAVEDNPDNMLTLRALLSPLCRLLEAADGEAALALAAAHIPDLILMDIAMPGMSGIEALKQLRRDRTLRDIPVVAVSARAMRGDRENFLGYGFDSYISKPIDQERLQAALAECLSKRNGRDRPAEGGGHA